MLKAECKRCQRSWNHDKETTCCFWCGCKDMKITDILPTGEEFSDDDTQPGRMPWNKLIKDLDLDNG